MFLGEIVGLPVGVVAVLGVASPDVGVWAVDAMAPISVDGQERTYPIPAADGVTIDRDAQVIVVRHQGGLYAFNLACPHENTALRWRRADNRFQCPRHESKYLPDGTFIEGRATRHMDRLPVRRDGSNLVIDLSRIVRSDLDKAAWDAAVVKL